MNHLLLHVLPVPIDRPFFALLSDFFVDIIFKKPVFFDRRNKNPLTSKEEGRSV